MANQTVYPYGTDGELPSSIGLINDLTTGGVDKALTAQQGVVIGQRLANVEAYEASANNLYDAIVEFDEPSMMVPGAKLNFYDSTGVLRHYKYMGKYYTELDWTTETSWLDLDNADKYKIWYFLESPDLSDYTLGAINSSGVIGTGSYKITDYIEIPEAGLPLGGGWFRRYVVYDSNKDKVSTSLLYGGKVFKQTDGAYVRIEFEDFRLNWNYGYKPGTSSSAGPQRPHVRVFPNWDLFFDYSMPVDWKVGAGQSGLIPVTKGEVLSKMLNLPKTASSIGGSQLNFSYYKYDSEGNRIDSTATSIINNMTVNWDGFIQINSVRDYAFHRDSNTETLYVIVRGIERTYKNPKKWLLLGDSISAHTTDYASQGYGWLINSEHEICVTNRAASGDATSNTLSKVNDIDFTPYDLCTIAIGTNDLGYNITKANFRERLHSIIDKIQTEKPSIKIGIFNLFRRSQYPTDDTYNGGNTGTFGEFETIIKEVAEEYGIPMLDVEHQCQANFRITTYKENYSVNGDGLHPTNDCHKLFIYPLVKEFINKLLG